MSATSRSARVTVGKAGVGDRRGEQLEALLLYEDFSTGVRGKQTLEEIARQLALEGQFKLSLWKFDVLAESALHEQASAEAARADIVLLSAHGHRELPATVRDWCEQWLESKRGEPNAVALSLDASSRDTAVGGRILNGLQAAAQRSGAEVFLHLGVPAPSKSQSVLTGARDSAIPGRAPLYEGRDGPKDPSFRDWGLNE